MINLLKSLKGFNCNIYSSHFQSKHLVQKGRYTSRLYKRHLLRFLLQKAEIELNKEGKKGKEQERSRKTFCPSNANGPFREQIFFLSFFLFFNSGSGKYSKQISEAFSIRGKFLTFPDYNRFLTSLRSDALIKFGNWDLSSFHQQLEVSFPTTNESRGTGSLFYTVPQTSNSLRFMLPPAQSHYWLMDFEVNQIPMKI